MTVTPTAAVAVADAPRPLVPLSGPISDLDSAYRYAAALAQASIVPNDLRNSPSNVLLVILYGQQLNVPPVIAIQTISVVKGRPQIAGKLLLAKVREAGHRTKITDHTDRSCTVTITRGDTDEQHTETFTLDDAVASKLVAIKDGKPYARSKQGEALPWENYTKRMLMWRAVGYCVDAICPEVRMGFAVEGEFEHDDDRPSLGQVAAQRTRATAVRADRTGPPPEYTCPCGAAGEHYEDDCPNGGVDGTNEQAAVVAQLADEHDQLTGTTTSTPDRELAGRLHTLLTGYRIDGTYRTRVLRALARRADITGEHDLTTAETEQIIAELQRILSGLLVDDALPALDQVIGHVEDDLGWST